MVGILTFLFVLVSLFLALFIYIQQGKGDMGLGGLGGGSQTLFGGSGGQGFFEKATWLLGAIFILGALGLSIFKTTYTGSRIKEYQSSANNRIKESMPKPEKSIVPEKATQQKK